MTTMLIMNAVNIIINITKRIEAFSLIVTAEKILALLVAVTALKIAKGAPPGLNRKALEKLLNTPFDVTSLPHTPAGL